jgi:undecaprenyl-diphosphatase
VTLTQSFLLGIVQGLTEFLPVSSTAHLMLAQVSMGLPSDLQGFDILLHAGTLIALVLCYPGAWWAMIRSPFTGDKASQNMLTLLVLATIPGAVAGVLFADAVERSMGSIRALGWQLLFNAALLIIAERCSERRSRDTANIGDALGIGIAQAIALVPGISRSAITIAAGRARGLRRRDALDFSFLMATPIIAGATLFAAAHIVAGDISVPPAHITIAGIVSACISSIAAILFLRAFVVSRSLAWFALYLVPIGLLLCVGLSDKMLSL